MLATLKTRGATFFFASQKHRKIISFMSLTRLIYFAFGFVSSQRIFDVVRPI